MALRWPPDASPRVGEADLVELPFGANRYPTPLAFRRLRLRWLRAGVADLVELPEPREARVRSGPERHTLGAPLAAGLWPLAFGRWPLPSPRVGVADLVEFPLGADR
ncbi:hypothetical protein BJ973_003501 [Actinoplanes tereljensis]|uniref:hypothetical protein n=1 Tax=Paractinoplanes tereljensis TaxID=571912 RepID=UPI001940DC78|nr:hypothetical protein [Actinoplanes tereljensis]